MRAGTDITEVEAATKIRARYLRAMEHEEWGLLPGPTFIKSFLRTYADYLGLDGKLLVDEYKLRHEPPPDQDPQPLASPLGRQPRGRLRAPTLPRGWAVGLSVAGLLALLLVLGSIGEPETASITTTERTRTAPRPAPAPPPPPKPTRVSLRLEATEEVYVCLRDADGELIVNESLLPEGGERSFSGRRFRLTVGRPTIRVRVNGRRLRIPDSGEPVTYELKPTLRKLLPGVNACE